MAEMGMKCLFYILFIIMVAGGQARGQEFTVMFYNTENLFDTSDDTLKDDADFLPDGSRRWTYNRYRHKIDAIARVIAAAGGWEVPAVVGLCEVENMDVVRDLEYRSILANASYRAIHRDSPDRRGIDLCLLYRPDVIKVTASRSWIPSISEGEVFDSRNLLYVKTAIEGDTLHIILCHWPSKRGGELASKRLRENIALLLCEKIDSIQNNAEGEASILVMGDFNTTPDDPLISRLTEGGEMVNLAYVKALTGEGSYRYRGIWEMIDQVIVSCQMTGEEGPFVTGTTFFRVFSDQFLLEDDPDYPGKRPVSTFRGFTWSDGYSDHLPVLVNVRHRDLH